MAQSRMEKTQEQAQMFKNRLAKRAQYFRKWSKREKVTAYRIYDRDIPEIPLSVDFYEMETGGASERYACMALYERPYEKDPREEDVWLDVMRGTVEEVLGLPQDHAVIKMRRRQKGSDQYEKRAASKSISGVVSEGRMKFYVNLSDYLDTGLFLDHRPLRRKLSEISEDRRVLNLFGYTGSLSVAAACGGASYVQTVDLSNTYLGRASDNLELNGYEAGRRYVLTRADVCEFLRMSCRKRHNESFAGYDIILLDPPTFSNSSMTNDVLDINRQWPELVEQCLSLLNPGGILYFSTNSRRLSFDADSVPSSVDGYDVRIDDVTVRSLPEDFKNHRIHRCWKMQIELPRG